MNTRIEKDFLCQTAIHYNNEFYTNTYSITLSMLVEECANELDPNVAMDRITHYLDAYIQNSLLIDSEEEEQIEKYNEAGIRTCELPGPPHDQLFASILLLKLNAIMDGKIKITDLLIGSAMSNGVRYNVVSEVAENTLSGNNWWNNNSIAISDRSEHLGDNVVKLFADDPWIEEGFPWNETENI